MANSITSLPLQEKIYRHTTFQRAFHLIIFFLLLSLLVFRLLTLKYNSFIWVLAFFCESWFTFIWLLNINAKWNPVEYKTYPDRLLNIIEEFPSVDLFVTTADPVLEPPIITVNTVLSLLSVDYPTNKLACYVSDDSGSPITFYALAEASKFAKLWVPFCKKYEILVRAPFLYFSEAKQPENFSSSVKDFSSDDFLKDWRNVKKEYEQLSKRIEEAVCSFVPSDHSDDFEAFTNIKQGNHPSIVKVILENKKELTDVPHLVYISREKRPEHPHHYKAGAMNVLTRVSGVLTNAPFMLNVDCDMFANNPKIVQHAMCLLLGTKEETESGFVQSPQCFYGGLKDDPFGNQLVVIQEYLVRGFTGIQGPFYCGTGCFHRRNVIYGQFPNNKDNKNSKLPSLRFGSSEEFVRSATKTLGVENRSATRFSYGISDSIDAATHVADCNYESNTDWGTEVGWIYGSATEDVLTGLKIQTRGWSSVYCTPDPPAFLGCQPTSGPSCLTQMKRGATGLLEILFSYSSPIFCTINGHLRFRECLAYILLNVWGLRSIPELCYASLPAYCLLTNTSFLPSVTEPEILIPASIFVIYNLYTLSEYLRCGLSARSWWNNQRTLRIYSVSAWLFGVLGIILKLAGLSETVFEVTKKEENNSNNEEIDENAGRFTFDESPIFVPGTTLVLVLLTAIFVSFSRAVLSKGQSGFGSSGFGEIICSCWLVLSFMPFVKGLFGKGIYGIPSSIICKSIALSAIFVQFCYWVSYTN